MTRQPRLILLCGLPGSGKTTLDELVRRVDARNAEGSAGTVPITRELLTEYARVFEAPAQDELDLFDGPPMPMASAD